MRDHRGRRDNRGALAGRRAERAARPAARPAHVVDGIGDTDDADGHGSVTTNGDRRAAERRLARLADEHGVLSRAERRVAVGDAAALLGQIAAEEAADVILLGARGRGWRRRGLESRLADRLETETPVPVLIVPPRGNRAPAAR